MSDFSAQLAELLQVAREKLIIGEPESDALLRLATEQEKPTGMGRLATVVSLLGGAGLFVGIALIIAANWDDYSPFAKLTMFLVTFIVAHGSGFFLRLGKGKYPRTAEALNFLGGGLFVCGVALIAQIYNLNSQPSNGALAWLIATIPLAILLRSTPLVVMSALIAIIWSHIRIGEVFHRFYDWPSLLGGFEICVALCWFGFAAGASRVKESMGKALCVLGGISLGVMLYIMGFYRHFWRHLYYYSEKEGSNPSFLFMVVACLAMAAVIIAVMDFSGGKVHRSTLLVLLLASLAAALIAAGIDLQWLQVISDDYSRYSRNAGGWVMTLTGLSWILWFAWGLWLVSYGSQSGRNGLITIGIYGIALGLLTRYFDLIGTLAETGMTFAVGGVLLLLAGWGAEKWRRKLARTTMHPLPSVVGDPEATTPDCSPKRPVSPLPSASSPLMGIHTKTPRRICLVLAGTFLLLQGLFFIGWIWSEEGLLGRTILVEVEPYDPRDIIRGQYMQMNYPMDRPEAYPEGGSKYLGYGDTVYAVLAANANGVYEPLSYTGKMPTDIPADQVVLKGKYVGGRREFNFGIDRYFIPENKPEPNLRGAKAELLITRSGTVRLKRLILVEESR